MSTKYGGMRRFFLDRTEDVSGVSGTGTVAAGVVFSDGTVVLRWMTEFKSTAIYSTLEELERIHGHNGSTRVRWKDAICFACGACLTWDECAALHCYECGAGQGKELYYERDPNPSLGKWSQAIEIRRSE